LGSLQTRIIQANVITTEAPPIVLRKKFVSFFLSFPLLSLSIFLLFLFGSFPLSSGHVLRENHGAFFYSTGTVSVFRNM
jgi:hypothetical protein